MVSTRQAKRRKNAVSKEKAIEKDMTFITVFFCVDHVILLFLWCVSYDAETTMLYVIIIMNILKQKFPVFLFPFCFCYFPVIIIILPYISLKVD